MIVYVDRTLFVCLLQCLTHVDNAASLLAPDADNSFDDAVSTGLNILLDDTSFDSNGRLEDTASHEPAFIGDENGDCWGRNRT